MAIAPSTAIQLDQEKTADGALSAPLVSNVPFC